MVKINLHNFSIHKKLKNINWFWSELKRFIEKSNYVKNYIKISKIGEYKTDFKLFLPWKTPYDLIIENLMEILNNSIENIDKVNKKFFNLSILHLFCLNTINHIYYPDTSIRKKQEIPYMLIFSILNWVILTKSNFLVREYVKYYKYWNSIKQDYDIENLTSALEEMMNDLKFIKFEQLQDMFKTQLDEKSTIIIKSRLDEGIKKLFSSKKIDANLLYTTVKRYQLSNIIMVSFQFDKPNKYRKDFRDYLLNVFGCWRENSLNVVYLELKGEYSYREIEKSFQDFIQKVSNSDLIKLLNQNQEIYRIQFSLINPKQFKILKDDLSLTKIEQLNDNFQTEEHSKLSPIELLSELDAYSEYYGVNIDKKAIIEYMQKNLDFKNDDITILNFKNYSKGELSEIFKIKSNKAQQLWEEIQLITRILTNNLKITKPISLTTEYNLSNKTKIFIDIYLKIKKCDVAKFSGHKEKFFRRSMISI